MTGAPLFQFRVRRPIQIRTSLLSSALRLRILVAAPPLSPGHRVSHHQSAASTVAPYVCAAGAATDGATLRTTGAGFLALHQKPNGDIRWGNRISNPRCRSRGCLGGAATYPQVVPGAVFELLKRRNPGPNMLKATILPTLSTSIEMSGRHDCRGMGGTPGAAGLIFGRG